MNENWHLPPAYCPACIRPRSSHVDGKCQDNQQPLSSEAERSAYIREVGISKFPGATISRP